jgi:O-antigen ligase
MLLGGGFEKSIDSLFDAKQISQLTTLTGRDQIWQVALAEWKKAPWFGYGLGIFGVEHQILIRMPFATSGHNQIIDGLGRVGTIGLSLGVLHYLVFLYIGFRYRIETHGLSLVLALSLAIRMITEVPVTLMIIGIDTLPYYLLLGILGKQMKYGVKREGT